jgi:hypothetical protein
MAITYYMLQIPPYLLFLLLLSFGGVVAGLGTYFFRRYINVRILRSHNEVTGFLFLAIASFYSMFLSFVVFMVWGQLNDTRGNVIKEGSSAMGMYRDIKYYPDTLESKQLMIVYLDFVFNVIDDEFPKMGQLNTSRKTTESLNRVFDKMENLNPKNSFQIQLVAEMFNHLNQLAAYRQLRISSMETEIPGPLWLPILFGALVTLLCAMLMDIEHPIMHITLNGLMGVFIGMILFIIIMLDHPYSGSLGIEPKAYKEIFTMEQWSPDPHATKVAHQK